MSTRVVRFNRTERLVHAVQALTFLILLGTGLAISINQLEAIIGHRELLRQIHLTTAFFFVFGPALVALAGDRITIRDDIREVDNWSRDDLRWLRSPTTNPYDLTPPVGRYNAGQKFNAIFTVYCTVAFATTGVILWQNRRFPFRLVSQANTVHQSLTYIALVIFLGHLYLSVVHPSTRASLAGAIKGTVLSDWAKHHHPAWVGRPGPEPHLQLSDLTRSMVLLLIGLETACLASRLGLEMLGANVTDPVVKLIYGLSSLPGTLSHQTTAASQFDLAALIWIGLGVALWYGAMRRFPLLPRIFPAPAKG